MKNLFLVTIMIFVTAVAHAQVVAVTANPPQYGYFVLKGSTHRIHVTVSGEVDTITAWSESSAGTATITATNTLSVGDIVRFDGLSMGRAGDLNCCAYTVTARTPTSFTVAGKLFYDQARIADSGKATKLSGAGFSGLINWSLSGPNANNFSLSAINSGHSYSLTNAEPWVDITANAGGTCSVGGTLGKYKPTSTMTVNLVGTSVDDPTKSVTIPYGACGAKVQVFVAPSYIPLFKGGGPAGTENVQSWVLGAIDQRVTWSASGPGCGTLADTNMRDALFTSGNTQGRCTLTATSVADNTKSDHAVMYVASTNAPYNVTARGTKPVPCEVDPAMKGKLYRVGATREYTSPAALPLNALHSPGNTVLIDPGTYHNYIEIDPLVSGTPSPEQPTVVMIGCADSNGNLPVFDAANATGASWISNEVADGNSACSGQAVICMWHPGSYSYYFPGPVQPAYVFVGGLTIQNARNGYHFTTPNGSPATWNGFSACVRSNMGSYQTFYGLELNNCGNGTFTDFNGNHSWGGFVGATTIEGSNIYNAGFANGGTGSHNVYAQGWMEVIQGNTISGQYDPAAGGAQIKLRGVADIIRNNRITCNDTPGHYCGTRTIDLVEVQDAPNYILLEAYIGGAGQTACSGTPFCSGDTMGMSGVIAWQEMRNDLVYGNIFFVKSGAGQLIHFNGDHSMSTAANRRNLYYYSNTSKINVNGAQMFDTGQPGGNLLPVPAEWQQVYMYNNIHWGPRDGVVNRTTTQITTMQTNMFSAHAKPTTTTPIPAEDSTGWTSVWSNLGGTYFQNMVPLDLHMTGLSSANVLSATTQPFVENTYLPVGNPPQKEKASTITGFAALTPVRLQINSSGYLVLRQDLTVLGAVDSGAAQ